VILTANFTDCEEAVDAIMDATTLLNTTSLQDMNNLANASADALVKVHQMGLQELSSLARALGGVSSTIVSSATTSADQLGKSSKQYEFIAHQVNLSQCYFLELLIVSVSWWLLQIVYSMQMHVMFLTQSSYLPRTYHNNNDDMVFV
jgi:DNA repair protein RadC